METSRRNKGDGLVIKALTFGRENTGRQDMRYLCKKTMRRKPPPLDGKVEKRENLQQQKMEEKDVEEKRRGASPREGG